MAYYRPGLGVTIDDVLGQFKKFDEKVTQPVLSTVRQAFAQESPPSFRQEFYSPGNLVDPSKRVMDSPWYVSPWLWGGLGATVLLGGGAWWYFTRPRKT